MGFFSDLNSEIKKCRVAFKSLDLSFLDGDKLDSDCDGGVGRDPALFEANVSVGKVWVRYNFRNLNL